MPMKKDPKKKISKEQDKRAKKKTKVIRSREVEISGSGGGDDAPPNDGGKG